MTLRNIKERVEQRPFRLFAVETSGATWIEVKRESDILIRTRLDSVIVVVFDDSGRLYVLEPAQISALELR